MLGIFDGVREGAYSPLGLRMSLLKASYVVLPKGGGIASMASGTLIPVLFLSFLLIGQVSAQERAQKSLPQAVTEAPGPHGNNRNSAKDISGAASGDSLRRLKESPVDLASTRDVLTRLEAWGQCSGDYTPPKWCQALPLKLNVYGSFSAGRQRDLQAELRASHASAERASHFQALIEATRNVLENDISQDSITIVTKQADSGDLDAMELMGWLYIQGRMPENLVLLSNEEHAYIWYGRAYLAGAERVKKDLDVVWSRMLPKQKRRMMQYFDDEKYAKRK